MLFLKLTKSPQDGKFPVKTSGYPHTVFLAFSLIHTFVVVLLL